MIRKAIDVGASLAEIEADWVEGLRTFDQVWREFLSY